MSQDEYRLKLYKATVTDSAGEKQELPVWALDLDKALESAEQAYGKVDRVRPVRAQEVPE